jgi:hypothetical protein
MGELHIRRAYIDDVVVKLKKRGDLLNDLKEIFDNLHKYNMILNSKNVCLVYHLVNYSAIRYRCRPSTNCIHLKPEEKSRSWQA